MTTNNTGAARRPWLAVSAGAAVVVLAGLVYWFALPPSEDTDDAQVSGHVSPVAARVGGTVSAIHGLGQPGGPRRRRPRRTRSTRLRAGRWRAPRPTWPPPKPPCAPRAASVPDHVQLGPKRSAASPMRRPPTPRRPCTPPIVKSRPRRRRSPPPRRGWSRRGRTPHAPARTSTASSRSPRRTKFPSSSSTLATADRRPPPPPCVPPRPSVREARGQCRRGAGASGAGEGRDRAGPIAGSAPPPPRRSRLRSSKRAHPAPRRRSCTRVRRSIRRGSTWNARPSRRRPTASSAAIDRTRPGHPGRTADDVGRVARRRLGHGELQGNAARIHAASASRPKSKSTRTAAGARPARGQHRRGHRRHVQPAAARQRHRQLREGRPARAREDRARSGTGRRCASPFFGRACRSTATVFVK